MKDITKKVVILENLSSPYVHQAILVMRDFDPRLESRAITEAERIVSAYLDNMKINSDSVSRKRASRTQRTKNNGRNRMTARNMIISGIIAAILIAVVAFILRY